MEVSEHCVAVPTANHTDFVGIDATEEKGHGTATTEGAGGDIVGGDPGVARDGYGSCSEETRDHGRGDRFAAVGLVKIHVKGTSWRGIVRAEVQDSADDGLNWARKDLPIGCMGKFLAFNTVLLGGEGERSISGSLEATQRDRHWVSKVLVTDFELGVFEPEGMLGIPGCIGVFPGTEEKVESEPNAIHGGTITGIGGVLNEVFGLEEDGHWHRLNPCWRIILFVPGIVHAPKAEVMFAG